MIVNIQKKFCLMFAPRALISFRAVEPTPGGGKTVITLQDDNARYPKTLKTLEISGEDRREADLAVVALVKAICQLDEQAGQDGLDVLFTGLQHELYDFCELRMKKPDGQGMPKKGGLIEVLSSVHDGIQCSFEALLSHDVILVHNGDAIRFAVRVDPAPPKDDPYAFEWKFR